VRLRDLAKTGAVVTAATMFINALAYLAPLLGARKLTPADFSVLATVLAICAVFSVPGVGLQTATAVRVARGERMATTRLGLVTAVLTAGALLLAGPVLTANLYLGWEVIVLTAALVLPVTVCGGWLGLLQGQHQFGRLAIGMVLLGLGRFGGLVTGIALGLSVTGILMCAVAGAIVAILPIALLVPHGKDARPIGMAKEVGAAVLAVAAILVMSYMDVLAARHLLSPENSAEYAVLSVLTKGALWAPQVVTVLALPHLAARRRGALAFATAAVAATGAVLVGAAAVFSELAVSLAGGEQYSHLARYAPAFALTGAAYALAFLFINTRIAYQAKFASLPAWLSVGGFAVAVMLIPHPGIATIVTCAASSAVACLVLSAAALAWQRGPAPVASPTAQLPSASSLAETSAEPAPASDALASGPAPKARR
jgi:O-antigen/teichoic acid export membrane protein